MERFVTKELERGSIIGPFKKSPFGRNTRISPLDTRPKKDSDRLRVILNLSFPALGGSVNHSIKKDEYIGKKAKVKYPSCDDLAKLIAAKGRNCLVYKRDLEAAYNQMFMDPKDINLLGFMVKGKLYFMVTLSMGSRSSCLCCQTTTDAITYIHNKQGYNSVNYLDDMGGAERKDLAEAAFQALGEILRRIKIKESTKKACPPSTRCSFLGVLFDTTDMYMYITEERRTELEALLDEWLSKTSVTLLDLQQLLGKLSFVCNTVRSGRVFVSRIINLIKSVPREASTELPESVISDLKWWRAFMRHFDGKSMITDLRWKAPDTVILTDACLVSCGGWSEARKEYWHAKFPVKITDSKDVHINELESLAVMVGLKVWKKALHNMNILMYCDNQPTCDVINTGKAKNTFAQNILREVCYLMAQINSVVKMAYKPGKTNRIADACSRIDLDLKYVGEFEEATKGLNPKQIFVYEGLFDFCNNW